jgi:hypothetical protein
LAVISQCSRQIEHRQGLFHKSLIINNIHYSNKVLNRFKGCFLWSEPAKEPGAPQLPGPESPTRVPHNTPDPFRWFLALSCLLGFIGIAGKLDYPVSLYCAFRQNILNAGCGLCRYCGFHWKHGNNSPLCPLSG